MSIFSKPEDPTPAAPVISREDVLLADLHAIDGDLHALEQAMRRYRREHFAVVDGCVVMRGPNLQAAATIREQWRALVDRAGKLTTARNELLKEWAALKIEREREKMNMEVQDGTCTC